MSVIITTPQSVWLHEVRDDHAAPGCYPAIVADVEYLGFRRTRYGAKELVQLVLLLKSDSGLHKVKLNYRATLHFSSNLLKFVDVVMPEHVYGEPLDLRSLIGRNFSVFVGTRINDEGLERSRIDAFLPAHHTDDKLELQGAKEIALIRQDWGYTFFQVPPPDADTLSRWVKDYSEDEIFAAIEATGMLQGQMGKAALRRHCDELLKAARP
jgi:hypothetical protein